MSKPHINIIFLIWMICFNGWAQNENNLSSKTSHDLALDVELGYRYYYDEPSYDQQKSHFPTLAISPKFSLEWKDSSESLNFEGFFRLDLDKERTHWDIRELYYQKIKDKWELSMGVKKVFWGVAESNHLVDVINQTDAVESFDGEKKLGQPMVHYSHYTNFGTFDLFYLPYHRKRTFPGSKGRFRFPTVIDSDEVLYENSSKEWHQDFALRFSTSFNVFDIGISHFYGTGREPFIQFDNHGNINAIYPLINQTGLDIQVTDNAFLWKLESIYRSSHYQNFFALTAGLEYTIGNIKNSGIDVGILGEYLYDERDRLVLNGMQNDLFYGIRVAFNDVQDTSFLIGVVSDLKYESNIFSIEASRRIGSSMKLELEGRLLNNLDENEPILSSFKNDSFIELSLIKYF